MNERRVRQELDNLRVLDQDLHLRRIRNASDAVESRDYVTLQQLRRELASVKVEVPKAEKGDPGPPGTSGTSPWTPLATTGSTLVINHALGDRFIISVGHNVTVTVTNLQDNHDLELRLVIDGTDRDVTLSIPLPSASNFSLGNANSEILYHGQVIGGVLKCKLFNPLL